MVLFVLGAVIIRRILRAGRVCIHRILILFKELVDGLYRLVFPAEIAVEQCLHLFALRIGKGIYALFGKRIHQRAYARRIAAGDLKQEAFEIAGNKDVHRGGHRLIKIAPLIIDAGTDKIGENIILVGCTDELSDGQPHAHGVISRKDIAEISRRNGKVHAVSHFDLIGRDEVEIG